MSPFEFERSVAAIYRALGADVKHNVGVGGSQIDVLVEETTESGQRVRTAVECKQYSTSVGVAVLRHISLTISCC